VIAVRPDVIVSATSSAGGTATLPLAVPNNVSLVGALLYTQVGVADPAAVQGLALSQAVRTTFCSQL
jgi:hypothetical protein